MIEKQWVFSKALQSRDLFRDILESRGIVRDEDVSEFLSPLPQLTYDPYLLKNMEETSDKILDAVKAEEKICFYGDYDADGICSVSLLMDIFEKLRADFFYYIPSRFDEGYGMNNEAIDKIHKKGAKLIITADCGMASAKEVEYAKSLGIETIVTDHHNAGDNLPDCLIINPKQSDCPYPEKNLSGCGVAFKLVQALQRKMSDEISKSDLNNVLDLVAIATVGDIVTLLGENRTLIKYGLRTLSAGRRLGLIKLLEQISIDWKVLKTEQIAYGIVPHLNAAGRMDSADLAVELLRAQNDESAKSLAKSLIECNQDRKNKQKEALTNALEILKKSDEREKFIVFKLPKAHEGVTGIVAGKIKDLYNLPTLIFTPVGQSHLKGTGRSIPGIDLYKILSTYSHMFDKFGGHEGACGLSMDESYFDELKHNLQNKASKLFLENEEIFSYKLMIEGKLDLSYNLWELAEALEKIGPFGQGNPKPLLALKNVIIDSPFYMGEQGKHVRFTTDGLNCILFGGSEKVKQYYREGQAADLAGYLEINHWKEEKRLQFMIEDIRHSIKG